MRRRDIPTDRDGYVPVDAMVRRLHESGRLYDTDSTHSNVLPNRLTPEQISHWWEDPSVCDI